MSSRRTTPRSPLSLGHRPGLSHDARTDLGHGVNVDKFHKARYSNDSFPYAEDDEAVDVELGIDLAVLQKIGNKIDTPYKSDDSLMARSADHSSRVNGNQRVAIGENAVAAGMVPFPGMYKKRMQAGGGANSPKLISPGQYNRTGTYRGWSKAPVDMAADLEYDEQTSPEELPLKKVRKLVHFILKNNVEGT